MTDEWIEQIKTSMPESLQTQDATSSSSIGSLRQQADAVDDKSSYVDICVVNFGERAVNEQATDSANWILGALSAKLNEENLDFKTAR